jgi:antitoxin (DNA-binding transcriptional repressor) of toxin-antitoxin stability system
MSANPNYSSVQVNLDEVVHNLPVYLRRAEAGETIIVMKSGKPMAEINPPSLAKGNLRPYGLCAGEFVVPDDFDASLPDEMLTAFEGYE